MKIVFLALTTAAAFLPLQGAAESRGQFAATVKTMEGFAWVSNAASGEVFKMDPSQNLYEKYYIRCAPESHVLLRLRFGGETNLANTNWVKVPLEPLPFEADPNRNELVKYMQQALQPAGASRGSVDSSIAKIIRPAHGSAVRVGHDFVVEWIRQKNGNASQIKLYSSNSSFLVRTNVSASLGRIEFNEASFNLKSNITNLILEFREDSEPWSKLSIDVLPPEMEKELDEVLGTVQTIASSKCAWNHLARAAVFHDFNLLNDCADEHLAALQCPGETQSLDLLRFAIISQEEIGDRPKVDELKARLQALGVDF